MVRLQTERVSDMVIVQCSGRIVQSDSAFALRNEVMAQEDAKFILLDFTGVSAIEGGGLGMLIFLQRWAIDRDIELEVVNGSREVSQRLETAYAQCRKWTQATAGRSTLRAQPADCQTAWC